MSVHQRARDGAWYVSWRDLDGKQHMKVTEKGRMGLRAAQDLDKDLKAKKRAGLVPAPVRSGQIFLDDIAQKFLDAKRAEGKSSTWLKPFAAMVQKNFYPDYCQRPAKELTYSDIVNVIAKNYPNHSLVNAKTDASCGVCFRQAE